MSRSIPWITGILFLVLNGCDTGAAGLQTGLQTANITNHGNEITFDISNTSNKSGDILVYVKKGNSDSKSCIHIFRMQPGTLKKMLVPCRWTAGGGDTIVNITWADVRDKGLIALASRLHVNW